ncbi:hypothetical protein DFR54_102370 [Vagococcus fluvialis]|uniref:hypothetical protein n=1 Tax=Vagococcus fluvialis TaxID=2738 RepID=UPI000DFD87A3|nr:hypothetical protein [Vagococcus fluvialis]RCX15307.1 hypothetical protein DFR54_102370 [Vagococcus fluvialis]
MRKDYKVTYVQSFNGKRLEDSYMTYGKTFEEMEQVVSNLHTDPHVLHVDYEEVTNND